ncbi:MAG: hypothetical protein BI182_10820 [Acetobacterium sp. MES1]|uniref:hypothetical protein n=1 Tax=Acetobacterium sp. MES1 TaxID=1899015 RepID=UPI000B9C8FA6|nr:hypothetical protein [Acetobacterium sp. MES1]OXS27173.1 MAG: hypothetical protein BI182_10820 [Acetobacterium sp. MES1]
MNYLSLMTADEIQYVCTVIPHKRVSDYFRNNPKEFAKICPGFRPTAISRLNVSDLLYRNRNNGFVSSFIEKTINIWLSQIQECIDECQKDGSRKDVAYIETLAQSFFVDNIALYFKLREEEHSETYISLLSSAATVAKKTLEERENLKVDVESKTAEIERLQIELTSVTNALNSSKLKQHEYTNEIKSLKQKISNVNELNDILKNKEEAIATLEAEIVQLKKSVKDLKTDLKATRSGQQLEAQIREEAEKKQTEKIQRQFTVLKPLSPTDMDEFKEFLGYNLEDIGVSTRSDYYLLLKQHLCDILFQGMPIIINRGAGVPMMKCIANTLVGNPNVASLTYNRDISVQEIEAFLLVKARIVCLDGFLGNYNETELLALLERHRNKIVFLTLAYDRTLRFIPYEIFRYCHYLNLNRIQTLTMSVNVTEDPSVVEESEADTQEVNSDARFSLLLKELLDEFGFSPSLTMHKCAHISSEQDLCCTLAFNILPYCVDVLQIAPFEISERFVKYAGDKGRCSYKNLFKEWFAR